ncbi:MAG: hypothetical protein M3O09_04560, partial [Acidobacteriota bacterium]|nr:hypothetical protein [Acidobacteriota bacterium]
MSENPKTRPALAIQTSSEHFTNGEILELVRDPDDSSRLVLLHKNAKRTKLVPQFQCTGQTYVPALLDLGLLSQLRIPETTEPYGSAAELSNEICKLVVKYCGVGEELGFLVSCFAIATFFSDCLPSSPCLVIFGAAEEAETLLRVLAWICWHPLLLTDSKLSGLPEQLVFTRLIHPIVSKREIQKLLQRAPLSGFMSSSQGVLRQSLGACAVYLESHDLSDE